MRRVTSLYRMPGGGRGGKRDWKRGPATLGILSGRPSWRSAPGSAGIPAGLTHLSRLPGVPGPEPRLPACSSTPATCASRSMGYIARLERCITGPQDASLAPRGARLASRRASLAPPRSSLARGWHHNHGGAPLSPLGVRGATREARPSPASVCDARAQAQRTRTQAGGSPRQAYRPRRSCWRAPPSYRFPEGGRGGGDAGVPGRVCHANRAILF